MRLLDTLKALLRRPRTASAENSEPGPYRVIELRVPADLEGALEYVRQEQIARLTSRGMAMVQLSDEAVVLSCIHGMAESYQIVAGSGMSLGGKAH